MAEVRSPLKYVGGKSASAERIVNAFPPPHLYTTFVDVFGGAGHILFAKPPYNHAEVYNDLSNNLHIFWQQIQCNATAVQERLDILLYSRAQYYAYYRSLFDGTELDPLERAVRFFYVLRNTGTGWLRPSPQGWNYTSQNCRAFRSAVELFQAAQARMKYVCIDNRDAIVTVKRYDSPRTLFYCDSPYFGTEHYYEASRSGFDHAGLADVLNRAKGYVALSYYPHPEIDKLYPASRWRRMTWTQNKHSAIKMEEGGIHVDQATELLLMNYGEHIGGLFDQEEHL